MKIKTANIRCVNPHGKTELKEVNVKKVLEFNGELFFIHRSASEQRWSVSHYETGLRVGVTEKTIAAAEKAFNAVMEKKARVLQAAVTDKLKQYGPANKLPEGGNE